ncbi:uncharacterized protein LOC131957032 [Physella acuta]|uniref:uncharacterized protein LOC131957032 n=1 Tax=Physella acuta TaxID=109671 RepID=UPI0027DE1218|nr:uncharacterized protein LOC131957032 [Physella acuta]XP_059177715.1 uncharacterized protein LOC131957032 [Physella acuta]XP_059177717.1 uncharacterized protein LOC131957032 [Physella acuta]XP_059177718.1 uncharacterized protein LOC131957032 [Physella acuta]
MEAVHQARKLYIKKYQHCQASFSEEDKELLDVNIQRFIYVSVKEVFPPSRLFSSPRILEILKNALRQHSIPNNEADSVAKAFESLEKYFLLLVLQPWKPEFKKIKMYGGFYRSRIKSVLPDCEFMFESAGYTISTDTCIMIHDGKVEKDALLLLAFDCKICFVLCRTIADHYSKIKGLGFSLNEAVSNILHNEWSKDSRPQVHYVNGHLVDISSNMKNFDLGPPALPKREPISNNLNGIPNRMPVKGSESIYGAPSAALRLRNVYLPPSSPLAASNDIVGIVPLVEEILPELPQGTCEEHIMESIKALEKQNSPQQSVTLMGQASLEPQQKEDWKWLRTAVPGHYPQKPPPLPSHVGKLELSSSLPTPPLQGYTTVPIRSRIGSALYDGSYDEGIDGDVHKMYTPYPQSVKYTSVQQQQIHPKYPGVSQPSFTDQGYRTSDPFSSPISSSSIPAQQTIYQAPNILTDGIPSYSYRQPSAPPPVPSRALKPNLSAKKTTEDFADGDSFNSSYTHYPGTLSSVIRSHPQTNLLISRQPNGGAATLAEPLLRREKQIAGKSNSLHFTDPKASLQQQALNTRSARSMDISLLSWDCKSCTAHNTGLDIICSVCSCSRHGPDVTKPQCGQTKKACPGCTLENDSSRNECEACGGKLQDRFTYV